MDEILFFDYTNGAIGSIDAVESFEKYKHTFLHFKKEINNERLTFIATTIASFFLKSAYKNIHKMKTDITQKQVNWVETIGARNSLLGNIPEQKISRVSKPINYKIIRHHLWKNASFNHKELMLPELISFWMDRSVNAAMNFYYHNGEGEINVQDHLLKQQYGKAFSTTPKLNQEGFLITSFLELLTKRISSCRNFLVINSHHFYTSNWLFTLKEIINDIISLLDITLNQLYLKAYYDKKQVWNFDKEKLGNRNGRRLFDKLNWIKIITGIDIKIEREKQSLKNLKEIRNHLNHFDPPAFSATLNEITHWLNQVFDVVRIVIEIRLAAGETINKWLIELYLQHDIIFAPYAARDGRINHKGYGYNSLKE